MGAPSTRAQSPGFDTVSVTIGADGVAWLRLNRPHKGNAANMDMLRDLTSAFRQLDNDEAVKCIVLAGQGKHFGTGLDLQAIQSITSIPRGIPTGEQRRRFFHTIQSMQEACSAPELCSKPVIAAIHGACFGLALDLVTAADLRVCTHDARFCVKEVDLGITADLGSLQRLPALVGHGRAVDLALTAREFSGQDAVQYGLAGESVSDAGALGDRVTAVAGLLASKPALALAGTKEMLKRSRGQQVAEGLREVALWNAAMLWGEDVAAVAGTRAASRSKL